MLDVHVFLFDGSQV